MFYAYTREMVAITVNAESIFSKIQLINIIVLN